MMRAMANPTAQPTASGALTRIRRKDRAVDDDAWITGLLRSAATGVMATVRDGQPFINTNTFVYDADQHVVYMHSARTGRTPENVAAGERVCFSVFEMGRLLPADRAFSMSVEYASVVAFGTARLIDDMAEKRRALALLVERYFPHLAEGTDYVPPSEEELALTAVYRIDIEAWSGKRKSGEPDHAGAFVWPPPGFPA